MSFSNVIRAEVPMEDENGILVSRERADRIGKDLLNKHIEDLLNEPNLKGKKHTVYIEGPIEEKNSFKYLALLEWEN